MSTRTITQLSLAVVALASAASLVYLILGMFGVMDQGSVALCITPAGPPKQPPSPPFDPPIVHWLGLQLIVCFLGFAGGNLLGHRRIDLLSASDGASQQSPPNAMLQTALVALFAVGAGALMWETFAVAHNAPTIWPITNFVRCANDVYPWPTLVGALVVSILVGHWLGFQTWWRRVT
jgi:hypothetical protein